MANVAIVTMVYNEPVFLSIWRRYYASEVGESSCYVVDHGSDDGSTDHIGSVNLVKIPRSPMDDKKRAKFISEFCSAMLEWYDAVIYTDVDEFVVADPKYYSSLSDFCERTTQKTTSTIGFNVIHVPDTDDPLADDIPVLTQRRWVRFEFAMCKPLLTRVPIKWTPGFHGSDQSVKFDHLFLFHLHHFDIPTALRRLAKTRTMPWSSDLAGQHQRYPDKKYEEMVVAISKLPKESGASFELDDPGIQPYLEWIDAFITQNPTEHHRFYVNAEFRAQKLQQIPDRFKEKI